MSRSPFFRRSPARDRRDFLLGPCAFFAFSACTPPKYRETRIVRPMGERVPVGSLIYNVLETKWATQLGELSALRSPKRQFLMVRLSVTNGGGSDAGFPLLSILNDLGETIHETENGDGVQDWIGLVRNAAPGESIIGWILFDAPQMPYNLQVTDGKLDNEKTAIIELPYRIN